jgi:hypothetical protein
MASAKEFCDGKESAKNFTPLLEEALKIGYDERPNYNKLIFMMKYLLIEKHITPHKGFRFYEALDDQEFGSD